MQGNVFFFLFHKAFMVQNNVEKISIEISDMKNESLFNVKAARLIFALEAKNK